MNYLQRPELMREIDPLPSHYWEPMPDEEDVAEYNARLRDEYEVTLSAQSYAPMRKRPIQRRTYGNNVNNPVVF